MLLSNNSELFKNLVEEINRQTGVLEEYIEKDFYVITILKELGHRMGILGCSTAEMKMSLGC